MGFWRESVKWWIGPGAEVWTNFNVPLANLTVGAPGLNYTMARSWPLTFRDADSLRSFLTLLHDFVNDENRTPPRPDGTNEPYVPEPGNVSVTVDGRTYTTVEEVLEIPERLLGEVQITAQGSRFRSFSVILSNRAQAHYSFPGSRPHVTIIAHEAQQYPVEDIRVNRVSTAFTDHTRPLTLLERARRAPVIIKRTESEYYADNRARKVRIQSWVLGIIGGVVGAGLTRVMGWH